MVIKIMSFVSDVWAIETISLGAIPRIGFTEKRINWSAQISFNGQSAIYIKMVSGYKYNYLHLSHLVNYQAAVVLTRLKRYSIQSQKAIYLG